MADGSPITDDALVARVARRDDAALRELWARHASLVFTVAARVLPSAQAEEVVQEVFLTLWQKHESFDHERGSVRSWLARIARNRALNEARRARGRHEDDDQALEEIPDATPEPDEREWAARRQAAVRAAVDALPDAERRALTLAFLDELSHEQVARALGTPLGTTKTRIRRGLARLAGVLAAALVAIGIVLAWRERSERAERDSREARERRALEMVTASDVVPRRLEAGPSTPTQAHGQFRARPGSPIVVLTTTSLPPLADGERYVAWARVGEATLKLGVVRRGEEAHALAIAEDTRLGDAGALREVYVTRELDPRDLPRPTGALVIGWERR